MSRLSNLNLRKRRKDMKGDDDVFVQTCPMCGGLHFGSVGCPYQQTVCDVCHKTLLQHEGRMFCEGGKTLHNPTSKFCTCAECVEDRMKVSRKAKLSVRSPE